MTVSRRVAVAAALLGASVATGCSGGGPNTRPGAHRDASASIIRVLVAVDAASVHLTSSRDFTLLDRDDKNVLVRARANEQWRVERENRRVRAVRADGRATGWVDAPIVARADRDASIVVATKPYRGQVAFYAADNGVRAVNWIAVDEYLAGVVASEMGERPASDLAALEAQAVAARSYAYVHTADDPARLYDVTAGVADQAYGGVAAENTLASRAVASTRGLVLLYQGRAVNAPYHSTCGGSTAAASELWRTPDEPYLQRVSDRIPHSDRYYCDLSPRFHWTRTFDAPTLNEALAEYLGTYAVAAGRSPGAARNVVVSAKTPSGRAASLAITTDRGTYVVQGNDIRSVLRSPGGEILNSTYFSVEASVGGDGQLARLTLRGAGYGHGVGMCQWGAIGRARAGQDFRSILRTYFPGTSVGRP